MQQRAVVSAPGKLIVMGEHAVVYGCPALVAATNPRIEVEVVAGGRGVDLELLDFEQRVETSWPQIAALTEKAREAWQRYVERPTPERFAALRPDSPAHLVAVALGELASELASGELPPVRVRIESEVPVGSGFGSSAATAVAVIGGTLALLEGAADLERIDSVALEVERRQHGLPSGADHRTILHGGVVWAHRSTVSGLTVASLPARLSMLARLQVFQTGRPAETTGEVVAAVRRNREQNRETFRQLLDRMQVDVERLRDQLVGGESSTARINELIRDYERCLEAIGVVPDAVRETIRQVEDIGGSAKISGAGALSGDAAGCLLVFWPEEEPTETPTALAAYRRQRVELGAEGLRLEELE